MCGICGVVGRPPNLPRLKAAMNAMEHRGPDDQGEWSSDRIMLGHQRLSIIDLSSDARQPIADEKGLVQVVFNGEIYNFQELRKQLESHHEFRSSGDSVNGGEIMYHRGGEVDPEMRTGG